MKLVKVEPDFKQILNNVFQVIESAWAGTESDIDYFELSDALIYLTSAAIEFRRKGLNEPADLIDSYFTSHYSKASKD